MQIAINADAAFRHPRTGVEEYTYQLIKHLAMLKESQKHRFILYTSKKDIKLDWRLPDNFKLVKLAWPLPMWTQIRLANELLFHKPEAFFIPVHVLPFFSPQNSVVAIHGLEYEYYPQMYPWFHLKYIRWATKNAFQRADRIIAVSKNTKKDLVDLYNISPEKIFVVHHGFQPLPKAELPLVKVPKYILYLGRIELKKNVQGLIKSFELLKQKYQVPHKLFLAGPPGFGYQEIKNMIQRSKASRDIIEKGYVSKSEKYVLFKQAEMFVLPSFYEGFGMPILEAQAADCPVVASNISSLPEVAGSGALLINPRGIEQIAKNMYKIISSQTLRQSLIKKGRINLNRFSWQKCARQTLSVLLREEGL